MWEFYMGIRLTPQTMRQLLGVSWTDRRRRHLFGSVRGHRLPIRAAAIHSLHLNCTWCGSHQCSVHSVVTALAFFPVPVFRSLCNVVAAKLAAGIFVVAP